MCEILCSTGALLGNSNNRDYRLLKDLSKQLMCDGFEFMMYSSWYDEADTLISTLRSMKLYIPVMHCEKHIGEAISKGEFDEAYRRFDINCNIAKEIGAGKIVVHLWDVFDTKMAAFHDQLDWLYKEEYEWLWKEHHICHYHVNDYAGGYMEWKQLRALPIGHGHIDFKSFFEFIRKIGYEGTFTVESTALDSDGVVNIEMLNAQLKYIREAVKCS